MSWKYYYGDISKNELIQLKLDKDDLFDFLLINKSNIYTIYKTIKIDSNNINITLYTSECVVLPEIYINNYKSLPEMYTKDPLNETDINIINLFN